MCRVASNNFVIRFILIPYSMFFIHFLILFYLIHFNSYMINRLPANNKNEGTLEGKVIRVVFIPLNSLEASFL